MKGISLITNFGCDSDCWYCIWRDHPLENIRHTSVMDMDWKKFKDFLQFFPQDKLSISGGGDPFYKVDELNYQNWWKCLFAVCNKYNKKIDIHTSKFYEGFDNKINKLVLHVNYTRFFDNKEYLYKRFGNCPEKLRLAVVLVPTLSLYQAKEIIEFTKDLGCQLSFRQWVTQNHSISENVKDMLDIYNMIEKESDTNIRYISQADYNTYYMPDNNLYTDFFCENQIV